MGRIRQGKYMQALEQFLSSGDFKKSVDMQASSLYPIIVLFASGSYAIVSRFGRDAAAEDFIVIEVPDLTGSGNFDVLFESQKRRIADQMREMAKQAIQASM